MSDISTKLTYLDTTKQLLKTEINKINNVLTDESTFRSYPQELFNGYLDVLNNGTDTLWNNLEKVSASGETPVLENVETAPIKMVLNGNTIQDGTPTPDTPVNVDVVTGENVVSVSGKNLVDYLDVKGVGSRDGTNNVTLDSSSIDGDLLTITKTYQQGGGVLKFNNISLPKIEQGEIVTISFIPNKTIRGVVGISNYNGGGTNNITTYASFVENSMFEISLEALSTYDKLGIFIQGLNQSVGIKNLLVERSSTATPYAPYSKTDYPINLGDIELCKINTYKDYFHKDSGKWYVHKEMGKYINTNTSGIYSISTQYTNVEYVGISKPNDMLGKGSYQVVDVISDKTSVDKISSIDSTDMIGKMKVSANQNTFWIGFAKGTGIETERQKLSGIVIYYPLATPTETEITNSTLIEQLEAISKAKSVKDKTYITQTNDELPFILDVEAIKEYEVN